MLDTYMSREPDRKLELLQRAGGRPDWYGHTLWARTRPEFQEALPMVYYGLGLRTPTRGSAQKDDLLLYTEGDDAGCVSIDVGDLERLNDGEFLDDSLIAFWLKHIEHTVVGGAAASATRSTT